MSQPVTIAIYPANERGIPYGVTRGLVVIAVGYGVDYMDALKMATKMARRAIKKGVLPSV